MNPQSNLDMPDSDLLERIAARDQSALSELYDRHGRQLYGIILAVVRDTDSAEEILQSVFVQIWKNASEYRTGLGTPRTWMLRMAHMAAIERLRADRQQTQTLPGAPSFLRSVETNESSPKGPLDGEPNGHLASALSTLPPDERSMIDMAFLQGYSHDEIAQLTGLTPSTVRSCIRTGMVTLRSNLGFAPNGFSVREQR
jgi:RNA polymerase sigma-70 factor, ECF subfamily